METLSKGKTCLISGAGNVAQYAIEKILELGGKVITVSDSSGYILDEAGIDSEKLEFIKDLKNERRGRISENADKYSTATFFPTDRSAYYNPLLGTYKQIVLSHALHKMN